ncbi:expressed unknown protein [Seminavis robusta]|uniref:Uncharacterized protein n=1 Tax=Seminavis robusta TaxID=568900 RepID=A0A9N8DL11_9STRA|nr:expressed unknown protein [Seminavis robusta]|eukprot:Sro188_g081200.1 n/a (198) ;mRNA; f:46391-47052
MEMEEGKEKLLDSTESTGMSAGDREFYGSFGSSSKDDDESSGIYRRSSSGYDLGGVLRRSMRKVNPANIMLRVKPPVLLRHESLADQFAMAPTELAERMQLIIDPCLEEGQRGQLYYGEEAYYNPEVDPTYALTVPPKLYQQVLHEIVEARQVPCGLYFCCHGGDGAHTGVSHDDYVDIRIAWVLMGSFLLVILYLG